MKILLAVHHFPPRYTGGAEWRAHRTAAALQKRGHIVKAVAVERIDSGPEDEVAWQDEQFEGVSIRRLSFDLNQAPDPFRWEYDNPWIDRHLQTMMEEFQPDVFHLIGGYLITGGPLRTAAEMGIPTVVTLTDFWFLCKRISMLRSDGSISTLPVDPLTCARCLAEEKRRFRLPSRYLPGLMDRFWQTQAHRALPVEERLAFLTQTLNQVDAIISPSEFLRSVYVQSGIDPQRIRYSRQGRDFPGLDLGKLQKKPSPVLRVGYLGQIAWHKGVHILFEALAHLEGLPVEMRIYGDTSHFPEYAGELQRKAAADPRLTMAGVYPRGEISRVLQDLDVLVVPSLWYENSPNVILEAFAHRTPVIASDLGGMAELVKHSSSGLLFSTGDAEDLARQVRRLIDEPGLKERLSQGIQPVRSTAEEIDELESIYQEVSDVPVHLEVSAS
jgi:glycosyltransferase involved in cell wall biosynthesis